MMGWICNTRKRNEKHTEFKSENVQGELRVGGECLNWILKEEDMRMWIGFIWLKIGFLNQLPSREILSSVELFVC
jgi:hypothetical protein